MTPVCHPVHWRVVAQGVRTAFAGLAGHRRAHGFVERGQWDQTGRCTVERGITPPSTRGVAACGGHRGGTEAAAAAAAAGSGWRQAVDVVQLLQVAQTRVRLDRGACQAGDRTEIAMLVVERGSVVLRVIVTLRRNTALADRAWVRRADDLIKRHERGKT